MNPALLKHVAPSSRILSLTVLVSLALTGCSAIDAKNDDYKRASRLPPLEIPPSLSSPQSDDRYAIPDPKDVAASATYSEYAKSRGLPTLQSGYVPGIAVDAQVSQAHIERAGAERWLVINGSATQAYSMVKTFLAENSYELSEENPTLGTLETQWVTSHPRVEDDGILRNLLNNLLSSDNSSSLRDRYRFRIDSGRVAGTAEVFVTHMGLEEVQVSMESFKWQPRAPEPNKEADMLKRLLVKFGLDATKAAEAIANSTPEAKSASKQGADAAASSSAAKNAATVQARADGAPVLNVQDSFDRAWRRIGIAIDKAGLITQDQNRDQGVFFVQYSAEKMKGPDAFNPESKGISGFFDSITNLFSSTDSAKGADAAKIKFADKSNYRVTVAKKGDSLSEVSVSDKDGKKLPDDQARRFLEILSVQPF